MKSLIISTKLL